MSGIKYEVLTGDDLISALRGGRTGDLLDDAAYAAADEIERLQRVLQKVMARCADLLDEDQFNELDAIVRAAVSASVCKTCRGERYAEFAVGSYAPCPECSEPSRVYGSATVCAACNGSGEAKGRTYHLGPDDHEIDVECPACFGLGEIKLSPGFKPEERACHVCNGRGTVTVNGDSASEVQK